MSLLATTRWPASPPKSELYKLAAAGFRVLGALRGAGGLNRD